MARWVLAGTRGWTAQRIRAAMRGGREQVVPLPEAIPVSIVYFTAWVDADGTVQLRPDVYGHDGVQSRLLGEM
jgi:murein L,D-transpeptidase YcbB/YkuD